MTSKGRRRLTDEFELLRRSQRTLRLFQVACGPRFGSGHVRKAIIERMAEIARALTANRESALPEMPILGIQFTADL